MCGIPNGSVLPDGQDALFAVGAKNKGKNLRDRVVEIPAGIGRFELAIGTTAKILLYVTGANVAPMFPLNLFTAWAFAVEVLSAGAAIQSAVSN